MGKKAGFFSLGTDYSLRNTAQTSQVLLEAWTGWLHLTACGSCCRRQFTPMRCELAGRGRVDSFNTVGGRKLYLYGVRITYARNT